MPKRQLVTEIPALGAIDRSQGSLARQLAEVLRQAISRRELVAGERLPSTRALAESLGLSRGTVGEAYEQLIAEGYLETRAGSRTQVAAALHEPMMSARQPPVDDEASALALPESARHYAAAADHLVPLPSVPFSIAVPEGEVAMDEHWRRLGNRVRASQAAAPSGYPDPRGLPALRAAIADYLRKARAVSCGAENIIVTEGTQQGLYLATRVLLKAGEVAWAEDPAYPGQTAVLDACGIRTQRIAVDGQGFDVAGAMEVAPDARVAFVTPSHQYPLGMPLSMARRVALVEWARQRGGWIVEDDYDSELRYAGHPFPAMQGMDPSRVIYLGTFSKVLAPSLRMGYVVAPAPLIKAFVGARALMGRGSPSTDQHVLTAYMQEGYFETHIRRIRGIYAERRATLIEALRRNLPWLHIQPSDQGMHLIVWLPEGLDDVEIAAAASRAGIALRPLSPMGSAQLKLSGLMLGFGGFSAEQLETAVQLLRRVLEESVQPPVGD